MSEEQETERDKSPRGDRRSPRPERDAEGESVDKERARLGMTLLEAEIIAENLKESGTRR
jgi:hypothetical protein